MNSIDASTENRELFGRLVAELAEAVEVEVDLGAVHAFVEAIGGHPDDDMKAAHVASQVVAIASTIQRNTGVVDGPLYQRMLERFRRRVG